MLTVGVDIGGSSIHALVLDDAGDGDEVVGRVHLRTPMTGDRTDVLDVMWAAVQESIEAGDASIDDIPAVGIASPGIVIEGTVGGAFNVPGWYERFSIQRLFEERVERPCRVINDATAAAVGEHRLGAGRGHDNLLYVTIGTGVGGGLILGGKPYEGRLGGAGELGHMIVQRGGAVCPCGRRGCVEAYAGRRAMAQAAEREMAAGRHTILFDLKDEQGKRRLTSGVFRAALDAGDPFVGDLLDDAISALGAGIASTVNLLDVELVLIGGGFADKFAPFFVYRVEAAARPSLFLQPPHVRFGTADLGGDASALGAAMVARDDVIDDGDG
ncbi:MAG: ROK family protein [Actinobacteria bacterium]|nr:ROK family protein [Actinomycetota bacterium]